MHFVLEAHTLTDDLRPARDLPAQRLRGIIRNPDRRENPTRIQRREDGCVDLVGFDSRLSDPAYLKGIRAHDACPGRTDRVDHRRRSAGRFEHDRVGRAPRGRRPAGQHRVDEFDATARPHLPVFELRDRRDGARDIPSHHSQSRLLSGCGSWWANTTPTDSRAPRNRAGRRGGQLLTRARGSSYVERPAHVTGAPGAPVPDGRTIRQRRWRGRRTPAISCR
jgi:hypothetical protein